MQGLRRVILFDGECATCSRALSFIAPRLPSDVDMSFVALNSPLGEALLADRTRLHQRDSLVYLDEAELLQGAAAVERVLSYIPRWSMAGRLLALLPDALTESAYDLFAANRYRLNTRITACQAPSAALASRLVTQPRNVA